jgi:hypothetical protein
MGAIPNSQRLVVTKDLVCELGLIFGRHLIAPAAEIAQKTSDRMDNFFGCIGFRNAILRSGSGVLPSAVNEFYLFGGDPTRMISV